MSSISPAGRAAFNLAAFEAQSLGSEFLEPEQLALGVLKSVDLVDPSAIEGYPEEERAAAAPELKDFAASLATAGIEAKPTRRRLRALAKAAVAKEGSFSGHRSDACRAACAAAEELAGPDPVGPAHFLRALLASPPAPLAALLAERGLDAAGLAAALAPVRPAPAPGLAALPPFLAKYGRDLGAKAISGGFDPVIGRDEEIRQVAQALSQRKKNAPILVGDPGVGKTCIVEGLAREIALGGVVEMLARLRIVGVDMASLVAGASHRGDFEERLEGILKEAAADPSIVLFIDEIHTLVGAGGSGSGDAANIMKPALARGEVKIIGATTTAEYRTYIEKDPALERRFQVVWVDEPSKSQAKAIISGLRSRFESHYGASISEEAVDAAVELSSRYLPELRLPDKAIDILDQACAQLVLGTIHASPGSPSLAVGAPEVAKVLSKRCRIPIEALGSDEASRLLKMEEVLRARVMGQDEAISQVARTLRAAKAGLRDGRKPLGVFLLLGPTGTGKTELAKALAQFLFGDESALLSFDMSEYKEKGSSSKLIGAPPGYIGHDQEGQLTSKVRTKPYSVILFDEIEKADAEIFDLFLQIFDEGRLTDSRGRRADFSESVIIMTSNFGFGPGEQARAAAPIGFGAGASAAPAVPADEARVDQALRAALRPELLSRIQKRIVFKPLGREAAERILGKILAEANGRLASKGISLELSPEAAELVLSRGYGPAVGARNLRKAFESLAIEPLSRMVLSGELGQGSVARAEARGGSLVIVRSGSGSGAAAIVRESEAEESAREESVRSMVDARSIIATSSGFEPGSPEAILVADLRASTEYIRERGDRPFLALVSAMHQAIRRKLDDESLGFLKCTGDGFMATTASADKALEAAEYLVDRLLELSEEKPELAYPGLRVGLHYGALYKDPSGDRVGAAAHFAFRLQAACPADLRGAAAAALQDRDRVLATADFVDRLGPAGRERLEYCGEFLFKGFDAPVAVHQRRRDLPRA